MPQRRVAGKAGGKGRATKKRVTAERSPRKPARRKPSLLILECDSEKLAQQSLSIAGELYTLVRAIVPRADTRLVQTTSQEDLLKQLGSCKQEHDSFNLVVVIGHSNHTGLRLTANIGVSWKSFAQWVGPFAPKQMVLLACKAGQMLPAGSLFDGITSLKEVYASPTYISKEQCKLVVLMILYLLSVKSGDEETLRLFQTLNFMLTLGVVFRWTRKEYKAAGFAGAVQWNLIQHLLDEYVVGRRCG